MNTNIRIAFGPGRACGDATCFYDSPVVNKKCTLKEFIHYCVYESQEWGNIYDANGRLSIIAEYERNKLVAGNEKYTQYLSNEIELVHAAGGWGSMDYYILIKK